MRYHSTRNKSTTVSFREAVLQGLASDGGLFVPEHLPTLASDFMQRLPQLSIEEIGVEVLWPFVESDLSEEELRKMVAETFTFIIPVKRVNHNCYVLELFHGPTQAFKDVGARFMSRCLRRFVEPHKKITVLVATSGDTGGAVAHGFYGVENIDVVILYPNGGVSPYQEQQMAGLGKNITALAVNGTFDDCQALVKQAFTDIQLKNEFGLCSANSINLARLLPQMLYYFLGVQQLLNMNVINPVVSVPSGNLGNITAGVMAKQMGLQIDYFVVACNANDTFFKFLKTGIYQPKPSLKTLSNAMDVGSPSNIERLQHFFENNITTMTQTITACSISDTETLETIATTYQEDNYILDPHGAVALHGLKRNISKQQGLFLETAHPVKFQESIQQALVDFNPQQHIQARPFERKIIENDMDSLKQILDFS
ncbi:MAG: threonine synthase [Bacteroidetes bacterium]|nr:threonine synthase [Bacteroidota bacterium]